MILLYILFFLSLFLILHSYFIYPLSIWILSGLEKKTYSHKNLYQPKISILISAFNEEKVIEKTIRTLINSDYPPERLEVLIGSDKSTDGTCEVLEKLAVEFQNIKFFNFSERRGKASVINDLSDFSKGEILVFCDANTIYDKYALKNLIRKYEDENVGGISGKLRLIDPENAKKSGSQETTYWDLETWLKEYEGKLGMLIGANGGIYSIRKKYFEKIPLNRPVMDDFFISLKVLEKNKTFLYENDATAVELSAPTLKAEFNRKIRNNSIMMSTIKVIKKLLNPSYGLVSYGLWSHKIIRWFTPVLLILIFLSNLFLINEGDFYKYFFILQLLFYFSSIIGYLIIKLNINFTPFLMSYYFIMTNTAMLIGLLKFLLKKQTRYWNSTPR